MMSGAPFMNYPSRILLNACVLALVTLAAGCATPPSAAAPTATAATGAPAADPSAATDSDKTVPPGQTRHQWTKASEAEVAAALDKKFQEAAKQFVQLKRDDQVMFCKRYRDIGSMIPTLHCITEAELRKQVEDSDELRDQLRRKMGRCVLGPGCGAGQDPVSKFPLPQ
jgi:hypothetical protein